MGFLDRIKALFGVKKKEEPSLHTALQTQVDALERRLIVTDRVKRIEGGIEGFEMAFEEIQQVLAGYGGEGPGQDDLEQLRRRMELARQAAHLLREPDLEKRKQMCQAFLADFLPMRPFLHFSTKSKYERIRIDFESGRMH